MRCQNIVSRRKDAALLLVLSNQHSKSRIYSIYYSKRQWKAVIKTEFMSFVHQVIISSNISNHLCSVFHFFSFPNRRCFVVKRLHTVCYFFLNLKAIRRQQPAKTQWIYYLAILQHSRTLCCRSTFCSNVCWNPLWMLWGDYSCRLLWNRRQQTFQSHLSSQDAMTLRHPVKYSFRK